MAQKQVYGRANDTAIIRSQTSSGVTPIVGLIFMADFDVLALILGAGPGSGGNLDGAWKIEASNDYEATVAGSLPYGQVPPTATWVDITAATIWSTAIASVAHGTTASQRQATQAQFGWRWARVTFTPSAGASTVFCYALAKSWS